jgi:hypothetical protein
LAQLAVELWILRDGDAVLAKQLLCRKRARSGAATASAAEAAEAVFPNSSMLCVLRDGNAVLAKQLLCTTRARSTTTEAEAAEAVTPNISLLAWCSCGSCVMEMLYLPSSSSAGHMHHQQQQQQQKLQQQEQSNQTDEIAGVCDAAVKETAALMTAAVKAVHATMHQP